MMVEVVIEAKDGTEMWRRNIKDIHDASLLKREISGVFTTSFSIKISAEEGFENLDIANIGRVYLEQPSENLRIGIDVTELFNQSSKYEPAYSDVVEKLEMKGTKFKEKMDEVTN